MSDDPHPEMRCRCVHRRTFPGSDHEFSFYGGADPYYDRCPVKPTEEDGLCDHCRGGIRPLSDEPWQRIGECVTCGPGWPCCLHESQRRRLVDLTEPCMDRNPQEVPF